MASIRLSICVGTPFSHGFGDFTGCNLSSLFSKAHHDNTVLFAFTAGSKLYRAATCFLHFPRQQTLCAGLPAALGVSQQKKSRCMSSLREANASWNKLPSTGMRVSRLMLAPSLLLWFFSVVNRQKPESPHRHRRALCNTSQWAPNAFQR